MVSTPRITPGPRHIPAGWRSSNPRAERAREVATVLRARILAGDYGLGRLPSDEELAEELGQSRNAVRDALAELRTEGLITRRRGAGTVVVMPQYSHGLDQLVGLAEELSGHGTIRNQVKSAGIVEEVPAHVRVALGLAETAPAVRLLRLRMLADQPLSLDESYLPLDVGSAVLAGDLEGQDVFSLIEEAAGMPLGRAEVSVHATNADSQVAAQLDVVPGFAVFMVERITRLSDDRPVDVERLWVRGDRVRFHSTLHRDTSAAKRSS